MTVLSMHVHDIIICLCITTVFTTVAESELGYNLIQTWLAECLQQNFSQKENNVTPAKLKLRTHVVSKIVSDWHVVGAQMDKVDLPLWSW